MNSQPKFPIKITFRNMRGFHKVEDKIRSKIHKFEQYHNRIMGCQVCVEICNRHQHQGKLFRVTINLKIPEGQIVISHGPASNRAYEDVHIAVRDAFDAAIRRLQDHTLKHQRTVKHHEIPLHGKVLEIDPKNNHGYIKTSDGRLIEFDRGNINNGRFNDLDIGDEVKYYELNDKKKFMMRNLKKLDRHHAR
jgi:ribosome-associated translation inhibitor RaiA